MPAQPERGGMRQMGARFLLIGTISLCLIRGSECAHAQDASGTAHTLPAIEVTPTTTGIKPGQARNARRVARNLQRVVVYPTAPTPTPGSGIDADKVPASVNLIDASQIQRTGSLNIADA